jgi:hypothetical protein
MHIRRSLKSVLSFFFPHNFFMLFSLTMPNKYYIAKDSLTECFFLSFNVEKKEDKSKCY